MFCPRLPRADRQGWQRAREGRQKPKAIEGTGPTSRGHGTNKPGASGIRGIRDRHGPDQRGSAMPRRTTRCGARTTTRGSVPALVEAFHGGGHRVARLLLGPLADRGQVEAAQAGESVVLPRDGHLAGDGDTGAGRPGRHTDSALIVERDHGGGQFTRVEDVAGGALAGRLRVVAPHYPEVRVQTVNAAGPDFAPCSSRQALPRNPELLPRHGQASPEKSIQRHDRTPPGPARPVKCPELYGR